MLQGGRQDRSTAILDPSKQVASLLADFTDKTGIAGDGFTL